MDTYINENLNPKEICVFTGKQANYKIGVIEYNKKVAIGIGCVIGAVSADKVLDALDNIQNACFGTTLWPVVMDLHGNIIYRADEAERSKISVKEGWRQYISQHSHHLANKPNK